MKVVVCARRKERLDELAGELPEGAELLSLQTDLRNEAEIDTLFETVRETWGGVDVLVNNAGLGHFTPIASGEPDKWREMLELNVLALAMCTRHAISDMRERGDDGHVIHLSSMAAHRVPPGSGMYGATKYAVRALTESLRLELRQLKSKIRVSSVSPGFVETEFHEVFFDDKQKGREAYQRYKVLEAVDIADTIEFILASPPHMQVHDILIRSTDQPS